jgi:hypothetical protein
MMMQTLQKRRLLILSGVLIIAGILAFPLRETVYEMVVVPVAFIAWRLNLLYHSFSQAIWWAIIVLVVLVMLGLSLVPRARFRYGAWTKVAPPVGQVEALAARLRKVNQGAYFKWLIANRLGKLAYQVLLHHENGRPRSVFAPLRGVDWEPSPELQTYLETGLHGSFVNLPHVNGPRGPSTPLDFDITEVVEFLEAQLENGNRK